MENTQQPDSSVRSSKKNPFKIATIVLAVIVMGLTGSVTFLLFDRGDRRNSAANATDTAKTEKQEDLPVAESTVPDTANYLALPKIGMKIPIEKDIADQLVLAEVDNGYRLDVKAIVDYRNQGRCSNGGSSAIGVITKQNVQISKPVTHPVNGAEPRKSVHFDTTLTEFDHGIIYPDVFVSFENTDAACWDLSEGGAARGKEIADKVQKLNDALAQSLRNIRPIK